MTTKSDIERLFRANYPTMLTLAVRLLHDAEAARDIVHDVFESVLSENPATVTGAYLLTGVRFACLKHMRSLSQRERFNNLYALDLDEIEDDAWPDPEDVARLNGLIDLNVGDFRGTVGFGWNWDRLQFGDLIDKPSAPWFDLSLRYTIKQKHSLSTVFHYSTWAPDPSYKSENIISATHLLSYTGNPALVPDKSYDLGLFYSWYPNNNYSFSAFATSWIMGDRYVYDYEATPTGILRTIKQPLGRFMKTEYGISATLRFLNRNLVFTGEISHHLNHNGTPYNINHSYIDWYARVRYYLNDWNFSLTYISDQGKPDGAINGIWVKTKNDWYLTIGWANTNWNVKANILNMTRWNWRSDRRTMHSKYYDTVEQVYNGSSHALIQLTATYTFGFGKKVNCDNEPSVSGSAASAILK